MRVIGFGRVVRTLSGTSRRSNESEDQNAPSAKGPDVSPQSRRGGWARRSASAWRAAGSRAVERNVPPVGTPGQRLGYFIGTRTRRATRSRASPTPGAWGPAATTPLNRQRERVALPWGTHDFLRRRHSACRLPAQAKGWQVLSLLRGMVQPTAATPNHEKRGADQQATVKRFRWRRQKTRKNLQRPRCALLTFKAIARFGGSATARPRAGQQAEGCSERDPQEKP